MTSKGLFENEYHAGANQIRKDHKNILNRLRSIQEDADFVKEIASLFPRLPLVANERCGSWYIDPTERQVYSVYYKSTDGHMGQWDFNLRRSNLHLLDIIHKYKGCIVVDSTRRGKRIPDSLSKTVPIWCCAINRAVAKYRSLHNKQQFGFFEDEEQEQESCKYYSLPSCVSRSEHAQIEARMDGFAQKLLDSGGIDMGSISKIVEKPLRPLWFTPQSSFFINDPLDYSDAPFWPVICLSASQAVESGCQARPGGYLYVQGSGDDQEAWCHGLTPRLFWQHSQKLLNANSSAECEQLVQQIVASVGPANDDDDDDDNSSTDKKYDMIQGTTIAIGSRLSGKPPTCWQHFDYIINCTLTHYEEIDKDPHTRCCYLQLPIPEGKKGQQQLFESIPKALAFVKEPLKQGKRILIHCAKGQDRSVGIALAILIKYFDQDMKLVSGGVTRVDKKSIHDHLLKIISSRSKAAPSRATLKKINTYFMS